jgi:hypothetical protein
LSTLLLLLVVLTFTSGFICRCHILLDSFYLLFFELMLMHLYFLMTGLLLILSLITCFLTILRCQSL